MVRISSDEGRLYDLCHGFDRFQSPLRYRVVWVGLRIGGSAIESWIEVTLRVIGVDGVSLARVSSHHHTRTKTRWGKMKMKKLMSSMCSSGSHRSKPRTPAEQGGEDGEGHDDVKNGSVGVTNLWHDGDKDAQQNVRRFDSSS